MSLPSTMSVEQAEEYMKKSMTADGTFNFRCTKCGECCRDRDDIVLNAYDVFYASKKLGIKPADFFQEYCNRIIGGVSYIPRIYLKMNESDGRCPFLDKNVCSIHDAKPTACFLFPIGRITSVEQENPSEGEVRYFLQEIQCGKQDKTHTVREWAGRDLDESEEFAKIWMQAIERELAPRMKKIIMRIEKFNIGIHDIDIDIMVSSDLLSYVCNTFCALLYCNYNTDLPIIPQMQRNAEMTRQFLDDILGEIKKYRENHPEEV